MVELLLATLVGGAGLWFARARARGLRQGWRELAAVCGLSDIVETGAWLSPGLAARSGDLWVRLERYSRGDDEAGDRIVVRHADDRLAGLELRPEDLSTALGKSLPVTLGGSREVELGDALFDGAFYVSGPPARVFAVLDSETRGRLRQLAGLARLTLSQGELRLEVPHGDSSLASFALLRQALEQALEVAGRLMRPAAAAARLVENARADPVAPVRLQNLLVLMREFSEEPATQETLRAACSDPDPEVCLRAAGALGSQGVATLLALAENWSVGDSHAAAALAAVTRPLPFGRVAALLERALRARRVETARACLTHLGAHGKEGVVTLARVLAVERGALAEVAARALGATGAPEAEPALLAAVADERGSARRAAAEALGRVGTATAVLPLKECLAGLGLGDRALARAAREAVAQIQSRLPGASPGQLSLATGAAGQVSLAEGESGRLSLAPGEAGALSLPAEGPGPRAPGR